MENSGSAITCDGRLWPTSPRHQKEAEGLGLQNKPDRKSVVARPMGEITDGAIKTTLYMASMGTSRPGCNFRGQARAGWDRYRK